MKIRNSLCNDSSNSGVELGAALDGDKPSFAVSDSEFVKAYEAGDYIILQEDDGEID